MATNPVHIDISGEINDWKNAVKGKDVRSASVRAFTELQDQTNGCVDYLVEKGEAVDQATRDVQLTQQEAQDAVDYANNITEEYKQYADTKLTETIEQRQIAESSAAAAKESEDTASVASTTATEQAGLATANAERAKEYAEQCAEVVGFDGTASTVSAIDTQGVAVRKASGTGNVTITDAAEHPILNLNLAGKSEQGADPSPEYPQPIKGTGTVSTGANLFDASKIPSMSAGGATITNNDDGSFTISGSGNLTKEYFVNYVYSREETLRLVKPGKYSMTYSTIYPRLNFTLQGTGLSKELRSSTNVAIEITEADLSIEDACLIISAYGFLGTAIIPGTYKPMVWAKETVPAAANWEPYTGGKPSPSPEYPQPLDVTVDSNNLCEMRLPKVSKDGLTYTPNSDGSFTLTGTNTSSETRTFRIDQSKDVGGSDNLKNYASGQYTLSITTDSDVTNLELDLMQNSTWTTFIRVPLGQKYRTTNIVDATNCFIILAVPTGATVNITGKIQLERGPLTPWKPYQSRTATITLTEPLHGIGDYRDEITMTKRIDRCVELVFDGSEAWTAISTYNGFYYAGILPFAAMRRAGLCNQFPIDTKGEAIESVRIGNGNSVLFCVYSRFYDAEAADKGLSAWKAHLAVHPLRVVTYLDTPVETDLDADTQSAINALTTYTGATHVTITAGGPEPDVGLEYFGQQGDKVTVQDMCDSFAAPAFDDSGVVQGISGFGDFLNRLTSGVRFPSFFRDLKAGLKFVLHTGQLVNNGLCNEPGKYPLDAAYGRTLLEMIGNTSNLPGGAADIVSAIVTQNSNLEGYYSLSGGTRIPSGADMLADTYKVPGNYACIDNTIASTLKNCPISRAFILKVDLSTGNAYPRQTFLQFNNGKVFTRVFDAFENKWAETFSNLTNADLIHGNTESFSVPANGEYRVTINLSQYNVGTDYRLYATVRGSTWVNLGAIYCNNNQAIIDLRNLNSTAVNVTLWYTIIRK